MDRRPTYTRLALISLLVFLVAPMLKYLGQQAWMYMSSAVSPYSTSTLKTDQGNVFVSVGGERWASWFAKEQLRLSTRSWSRRRVHSARMTAHAQAAAMILPTK
jgi:hypothetical protein